MVGDERTEIHLPTASQVDEEYVMRVDRRDRTPSRSKF